MKGNHKNNNERKEQTNIKWNQLARGKNTELNQKQKTVFILTFEFWMMRKTERTDKMNRKPKYVK